MAISIFRDNKMQERKTTSFLMMLKMFMYHGGLTIPELSKFLALSIPTVTKTLNELMELGFLIETGKRDNVPGRFPVIYNLNPEAGYFIGVSPGHDSVDLGICDFCGNCVDERINVPFDMDNTPESLDQLVDLIKEYIGENAQYKDKILCVTVNISGRVNPYEGLSYSIFNFIDEPLADYLTKAIGYPTCIDNDTRAMTYGEYLMGSCKGAKNVIFVNVSWGIAIGIIINGELYFGKSGYSGEYGHVHAYDNETLCHCGKKGCLETEVSGMALLRETLASLEKGERSILSDKVLKQKQEIGLKDVLDAIGKEDVLCIDVLQKIADELGKSLAGIINIFNPEMLVIGGDLSITGDYITQPVSMAIKKYSLNVVNEDSKVVASTLKRQGGIIGACMIARRRVLEN